MVDVVLTVLVSGGDDAVSAVARMLLIGGSERRAPAVPVDVTRATAAR